MGFFENTLHSATHFASHGTKIATESMFMEDDEPQYNNIDSHSSPFAGFPKLLTASALLIGGIHLKNKYSTDNLARKSLKEKGMNHWVEQYAKSSSFKEPKINTATGLLDDSGFKNYIKSQTNVNRFKNLSQGIKKELGLIGAEKGIGNQAIRFLSSWKVGLPSAIVAGGLLGHHLTQDTSGFFYGAAAGVGIVAASRMYNKYRNLPKLGKFGVIAAAITAGSALLIKNSKQDYSKEDYIAVGTNSNYRLKERTNSMNISGNITLGLHKSRH